MKNYGNQILSIIVSFNVTMILNVGLEQLFKSNGSIQVSTIQLKSGALAAIVRIENYSKERINELKMLVPKESIISDISTSTTIHIEEIPKTLSTLNQKAISISLIPLKAVSTILIPINEQDTCCSVLNSEELKVAVKDEREVLSPSMHALYKGLQTAIIYMAFFAAMILWYKARNNELSMRIDKIEEKHEQYVQNTKNRLQEVESKFGRHKAILLRRLSDYSKELEFWRDTIRKVLYQSDSTISTADKLLSQITQKLGTFGTRANPAGEFETIQAMAQDIVEHENQSNKQPRRLGCGTPQPNDNPPNAVD